MNYITTTDLRTEAPQLIEQLKKGSTVTLIHRSSIIGVITPVGDIPRLFDVETFKGVLKDGFDIPQDVVDRKKLFEKHVKERYGKRLS